MNNDLYGLSNTKNHLLNFDGTNIRYEGILPVGEPNYLFNLDGIDIRYNHRGNTSSRRTKQIFFFLGNNSKVGGGRI